jgi:hypothetical protein
MDRRPDNPTPFPLEKRVKRSLGDKISEKIQDGNWVNKTLTRRNLLLTGAAVAVGGFFGIRKVVTKIQKSPSTPTPTPESDVFRIVLSPERAEGEQGKGNFDALRAYTEDPLMTYDEATNSGHILTEGNPEVIVVEMTYNGIKDENTKTNVDAIVIRRGADVNAKESIILKRGDEKFQKMLGKKFATVRLLGSEYGDSGTPGRPNLARGEQGGIWYAWVGAEEIDNQLQYYYADVEGNRLKPGEKPYCFSATFASRVTPDNNITYK